jgi:hypothetical protein
MFKDFSWGIVLAAGVGVLLIGIILKAISPSLPAQLTSYVPSSLKN